MADHSRDYEFGNALVACGALSLDKVREGLKLVEAAGGRTTLEVVLLEKGWISPNDSAVAYRRMTAPPVGSGTVEIPGFQVMNEVGAGSMGTVYRAKQTSFDRIVAIKIMSAKLAQNRENVERFQREARAAAKVQHPNLVAAYDVGSHQGRPYMVMEYIEGTTGARLLRQNGKLDVGQVVDVAIQMAEGLDAAHRAGLIHRDIRAEKTLFNRDGTIKLADLGLASESRSLTGDMTMSARCLSPELAKGEKKIDIRSDLYSLGCTLFHFVTGELPYDAPSSAEMAKRHANDPVPAAKLKRPEMGDRLNAILYKLMQKRPDDRYQTPGALINDLKMLEARRKPIEVVAKVEAPKPEPARPATAALPLRRPTPAPSGGSGGMLIAVAAVLVAAVAGGILFKDKIFPPAPVDPVKPPPIVVDDATAKKAQTEFDAIAGAVKADPGFDHIADVLRRYDGFASRYKGTTWEGKAIDARSEYVKAADVVAKVQVDETASRAGGHISAGRWRDALREYERFPARFLELPCAMEVKQQVASLTGKIAEMYARDKSELERLVQRGDFASALEKIQFMKEYALNQSLPDLEKREMELQVMKDAATSAVEKNLNDQYLSQFEPDLRQLLGSRRWAEAAAAVVAYVTKDRSEEEKRFVLIAGVDYAALGAAVKAADWAAVMKAAETGAGDPWTPLTASLGSRLLLDLRNAATLEIFRVQVEAGLEIAFKRKDKEKVELEGQPGERCFFDVRTNKRYLVVDGKRTTEFEDVWKDVAPLDHVMLAFRSLDEDRDKAGAKARGDGVQLLRAVLYLYFHPAGDKYLPQEESYLRIAISAGAKGARIYDSNIATLKKKQAEHAFQRDFDQAKKLVELRKWDEAKRVIERLLAEKSSAFINEHRAELDQLGAKVAEATKVEREFEAVYHGRVESLDGGRLRVTYDFETKNQMQAFESLEPDPKVKGKWTHDRGAIGSSGDQCAMRWRPIVKGDVEVEYELTPIDEPQNVAVDLYWSAASSKHYSVVFGFDIIFGKEDPKNTVEDNHEMPRTCILKYPLGVRPNDESYIFDAYWENIKKRQVGKAQGSWKLDKNKKAKVKVVRAGKRIAMLLDGTPMWEGEDGDYNEGSVLFYADSRARIDNLSITFKP